MQHTDINYLIFNKKSGELNVHYENGIILETPYVHLQKRQMTYDFINYNSFKITKKSFELIE